MKTTWIKQKHPSVILPLLYFYYCLNNSKFHCICEIYRQKYTVVYGKSLTVVKISPSKSAYSMPKIERYSILQFPK